MDGQVLLASILRHDAKQNTYKIALVRALNDIRLSYLDTHGDAGVVVPLRFLAEYWIAYYWPFMHPDTPIDQGVRAQRQGAMRNDVSFRPALTRLRALWRNLIGEDSSADGFTLIHEMRSTRRRNTYSSELRAAYKTAVMSTMDALRQPIRYAGSGAHGVFPKPEKAGQLRGTPLPGTVPTDTAVLIPVMVWDALAKLSLWVEALCVYEWSRFSADRLAQDRSAIYTHLTARPDNRRPLSWERNQVEILMLEGGRTFVCPWTRRHLTADSYDLDHLIPLSVYPTNELWNLVPSDRAFNQHRKRDRLPGVEALSRATSILEGTYTLYDGSPVLSTVLASDVAVRFSIPQHDPAILARTVLRLVDAVADARNLARF